MPRAHGKAKHAILYKRAQESARAYLITLGCDGALMPLDGVGKAWEPRPMPVRKPLMLPGESNRFRRSNREIAEQKQLEQWQLSRRAGAVSDFVIEV